MARTFAAADIGSNTAHVLVAVTDGELVTRIDNMNEWIPLGETVARRGEIPKDVADELVDAVKGFKRLATAKRADGLYIFATEGMRAARNHDAVLRRISNETGVRVDLITPRREAELSLRGVMLDGASHLPDLLIEVGGGSAQIGRLHDGVLGDEDSLPLGTGRIIAESGLKQPCEDECQNSAQSYIDRILERLSVTGVAERAVASGGVVRGLWRALHPDGEKIIRIEELEYLIWATPRLPLDRVVTRFGVKPKRASTLYPGALVYRAIMRRFELTEIFVSEFGIREGAVLEMAAGRVS